MTPLLRVLLLLSASGGSPRGLWDAAARQNVDPGRFLEGGVPLWESLGYSPSVIKRLATFLRQWPEEEDRRQGNGVDSCPSAGFSKQLAGLPGACSAVVGGMAMTAPRWRIGTRRCSAYGKQSPRGRQGCCRAGAVLISGEPQALTAPPEAASTEEVLQRCGYRLTSSTREVTKISSAEFWTAEAPWSPSTPLERPPGSGISLNETG